jgi:hypothetical protein
MFTGCYSLGSQLSDTSSQLILFWFNGGSMDGHVRIRLNLAFECYSRAHFPLANCIKRYRYSKTTKSAGPEVPGILLTPFISTAHMAYNVTNGHR